jgi:hypothetical protein
VKSRLGLCGLWARAYSLAKTLVNQAVDRLAFAFDTRPSVAQNSNVDRQDVERIARKALLELGVTPSTLTVEQSSGQPGVWRIEFGGEQALKITCGQGSTAQWVRQQIFEQFLSR